jgi:hypothetical protein
MEKWGAAYSGRAHFLCVGCQGEQLSEAMGQEMKLANCVNAVCGDGDMPSWGQLGCNGFIVLDQEHRVVASATAPFQQVRGLAFKHVETLVDALADGEPVPAFCPGQFIHLRALTTASLNGQLGVCLTPSKDPGTRVEVQLQSGRKIKVLPKNLAAASEEDEEVNADHSSAGG